jgi:hypothetical protein
MAANSYRADAVNLARNILGSDVQLVTDKGIALLAQAVLEMDRALLNGPNGEGYPGIAHDFETLRLAASKLRDGFTYDPGHSDLDNEQPVWVRCSLGDWRRLDAALNATKGGT